MKRLVILLGLGIWAITSANPRNPELGTCPICYEERDVSGHLGKTFFGCPHDLCPDCANKLIDHHKSDLHTVTCPMCRARANTRALYEYAKIPFTPPAPVNLEYIGKNFTGWRRILQDIRDNKCSADQACTITIASTPIDRVLDGILVPGITKLTLTANSSLAALPDAITQASDLTVLNVSNNVLNELPTAICDLKNLEELYVANNRTLSALPPCLKNLAHLSTLNIKNSAIDPAQAVDVMPPQLKKLLIDDHQQALLKEKLPALTPSISEKIRSSW